jgi:hypothetical protein
MSGAWRTRAHGRVEDGAWAERPGPTDQERAR